MSNILYFHYHEVSGLTLVHENTRPEGLCVQNAHSILTHRTTSILWKRYCDMHSVQTQHVVY